MALSYAQTIPILFQYLCHPRHTDTLLQGAIEYTVCTITDKNIMVAIVQWHYLLD